MKRSLFHTVKKVIKKTKDCTTDGFECFTCGDYVLSDMHPIKVYNPLTSKFVKMCILCVHSLDKLMRDLEEDFFANHKRRGLELVKAQQDKMDAWHASDEYKAERYRFKELFKKNDI